MADSAATHAQAANDATHSLPWSIAAAVPWLGSPFETGRQISGVVLGLASEVLKPSAQVGVAISPDKLFEGSRLNVRLLQENEPALSKISADARRLEAEASAIPEPAYLSVLGRRERKFKPKRQRSPPFWKTPLLQPGWPPHR